MAKNEVQETGKNALMLSKQYPESQYNMLVPIKTVAEIADIHKPVMNVVSISTNLDDAEIYPQDKRNGKYALTKKGLTKLMRAAGIKVKRSEAVLPTRCEKCAAVNRGIGKPVNCGMCGNADVKHRVVITMPQLTGENIDVVATKEIIVDDATKGMSQAQKDEFMKFRSEMCESKALNRALRIAMQIKPTYTLEELQKPFVVAYLVPNLDNPAVREEAVKSFFGATQELYGATPEVLEAKRTIYADEDDAPDEDSYIVDNVEPEPDVPEAPPVETEPEEEEVEDPTVCQMCGKKLTPGVINYSVKNYGKPYCMQCQQKIQQNNGRN